MGRLRRRADHRPGTHDRAVRLLEVRHLSAALPVVRLGRGLTVLAGLDPTTADAACAALAAVAAGRRVEGVAASYEVGGEHLGIDDLALTERDAAIVVDLDAVEARRRAHTRDALAELDQRARLLESRLTERIGERDRLAAEHDRLQHEAGGAPAPIAQLEAEVERARSRLAEVDAAAGRLSDAVVARIEALHAEVEAAERALDDARRSERPAREAALDAALARERDALARLGLPSRAAFLLALVEGARDAEDDSGRAEAAAALDAALAALDAGRTREAARAILVQRREQVAIQLSAIDRDLESLRGDLAEIADTRRALTESDDVAADVVAFLRAQGNRSVAAVVWPGVFRGRDATACAALLERLREEAAGGQIVVVSDSQAVHDWAASAGGRGVRLWTPADAEQALTASTPAPSASVPPPPAATPPPPSASVPPPSATVPVTVERPTPGPAPDGPGAAAPDAVAAPAPAPTARAPRVPAPGAPRARPATAPPPPRAPSAPTVAAAPAAPVRQEPARGPGSPPQALPPLAPAPPTSATRTRRCLRHRTVPATVTCDRCREMFCERCVLPVRNTVLCIDCALVVSGARTRRRR